MKTSPVRCWNPSNSTYLRLVSSSPPSPQFPSPVFATSPLPILQLRNPSHTDIFSPLNTSISHFSAQVLPPVFPILTPTPQSLVLTPEPPQLLLTWVSHLYFYCYLHCHLNDFSKISISLWQPLFKILIAFLSPTVVFPKA